MKTLPISWIRTAHLEDLAHLLCAAYRRATAPCRCFGPGRLFPTWKERMIAALREELAAARARSEVIEKDAWQRGWNAARNSTGFESKL